MRGHRSKTGIVRIRRAVMKCDVLLVTAIDVVTNRCSTPQGCAPGGDSNLLSGEHKTYFDLGDIGGSRVFLDRGLRCGPRPRRIGHLSPKRSRSESRSRDGEATCRAICPFKPNEITTRQRPFTRSLIRLRICVIS